MQTISLQGARFSGERELYERILADEVLRRELQRAEILRQRSVMRARLLSEAVRVKLHSSSFTRASL